MALSFNRLMHCTIQATDGKGGRLKDALMARSSWQLRYLVIEPAGLWNHRKVALPLAAVRDLDTKAGTVTLDLSRKQIDQAQPLRTDNLPTAPAELIGSASGDRGYHWVPHAGTADPLPLPIDSYGDQPQDLPREVREVVAHHAEGRQPTLRSAGELSRYKVNTEDGEHLDIDDLVLDDDSLRLAYLIIRMRHWLPGKSVICPPIFVDQVDDGEKKLNLGLTKSVLEESPSFGWDVLDEDYERRVVKRYYDHFHETPAPPT